MSSDDEFDYMSDKFVVQDEKKDVRPGLIYKHSDKRQHGILKKKNRLDEENKARFRPYSAIERERREEGMKEAIGSDNKGYALLQKMGYKPGSGIGKSGTGRVDPVNVEVKSDREGLGRKEALKAVAAEKAAIRTRIANQRKQLMNIEDYQMRMARERTEKLINADLRRSQRICLQLDKEDGYEEPAEQWFWPEDPNLKEDLEEADEGNAASEQDEAGVSGGAEDDESDTEENYEDEIEFQPSDKLEMLTTYLRETYFYCLWCGTKYNDMTDLQDNCPGPTRNEH